MRWAIRIALLVAALVTVAGQGKKTDAEIRQAIIDDSIARFEGSCPCPYNKDRAGRNCGGRSAYSRGGGAKPLCYPEDVTQKMVEEYRKQDP